MSRPSSGDQPFPLAFAELWVGELAIYFAINEPPQTFRSLGVTWVGKRNQKQRCASPRLAMFLLFKLAVWVCESRIFFKLFLFNIIIYACLLGATLQEHRHPTSESPGHFCFVCFVLLSISLLLYGCFMTGHNEMPAWTWPSSHGNQSTTMVAKPMVIRILTFPSRWSGGFKRPSPKVQSLLLIFPCLQVIWGDARLYIK